MRECFWGLTQAVETQRSVVEEVADVARLRGHGAEGVSAAGGEGVDTDEQHVDQQGPGVAVAQEVHGGAQDAEPPQEVPENHSFSALSPTSLLTAARPPRSPLGLLLILIHAYQIFRCSIIFLPA